jgi:hypothetical protein
VELEMPGDEWLIAFALMLSTTGLDLSGNPEDCLFLSLCARRS